MTYIDGFVIPVGSADRSEFIAHANRMDRVLIEHGATRIVEAWGDNVPDGKITDFRRSVQAEGGEAVAFSWIEWPDKATRDAAFAATGANQELMSEPMPFDGKRMIFGGFEPVVEESAPGTTAYVQGFVIAVPTARKEEFVAHAALADPVFMEHGAIRVVECWADDVPRGKVTDFYGAVQAKDDEAIVFSWIEWPDKATSDAMQARMSEITLNDPRFSMEFNPPPFDGMRMIYGGFEPVVNLTGE